MSSTSFLPKTSWVGAITLLILVLFVSMQHDKDRFHLRSVVPQEENPTSNKNKDQPPPTKQWMNGEGPVDYAIANAPFYDTDWILRDPTVRSFDAYSKPIRSRYSQVHWTNHGPIPLPQEVVQRYASEETSTTDTMAIVGYEVDQVAVDPKTGQEISVPITWAYNHHYMFFLMGHKANFMAEREVTPELARQGMGHGADKVWLPVHRRNSNHNITVIEEEELREDDRSYIFVSEGNGGEMRKSYHSYPRGYAQLVRQPHSFSVTPMQIDTWNRETMRHGSRFVPPLGNASDYFPKTTSQRILQNLEAANYNPLLECPCSDRLPKKIGMTYQLQAASGDAEDHPSMDEEKQLGNADECFEAASHLLPSTNVTTSVENLKSNHTHGICQALVRADGSLNVVWYQAPIEPPNHNTPPVIGQEGEPQKLAETTANEHSTSSSDALVGTTPYGSIVNATLTVNTTSQTVELVLKGPYLDNADASNERWFAIGIGASSMCVRMDADECTTGGPYAIVVLPPDEASGSDSRVYERRLDYHGPGRILPDSSLTVLSNRIERTSSDARPRRVVRLVRPLEGPTADHYSFDAHKLGDNHKALPIILATGCPGTNNAHFGRHCGHQSPDPLTFATVGVVQEIVRDGIKGTIGGNLFQKHCADEPYGDLVKQENPTCTVQTYRGGLSCCRHDQYLLDADQTIPWPDQMLEYRLKFRFYYQDFVPGGIGSTMEAVQRAPDSHRDLQRIFWATEAGSGEYDVPECETPDVPSQCVHTITSRWKVSEFVEFVDSSSAKGIELIYAAPHCHAGTCLSMELYNDDTGEILCRVEPFRGMGRRDTEANPHGDVAKYDEAGFIAIPPCLWSHNSVVANDGNKTAGGTNLPRPVFLSMDTNLLSIKRANNTFSHTGEMALWQMRGVYVPRDDLNETEVTIE